MKILFIAISESIHTVRWIRQIHDQGWELYLYPARENPFIQMSIHDMGISVPMLYRFLGIGAAEILIKLYNRLMKIFIRDLNERRLHRYIKSVKPDVIHTLETQSAGYLLLDVRKKYFPENNFPAWWHTNWGSDIYLFGRLKEHSDKLREILSLCDYYSCECDRDVVLAREYGFAKEVMPVYPNTGGFDLTVLSKMRERSVITSRRREIMVKAYQGWAGRALVAIRALARVHEYLKGYSINLYSFQGEGVDVRIASELFSAETGIPVTFIPGDTPHEEILALHGRARISIGLSISDAISTSVLEAMAMGSFPIQSWTSAANEWFEDGKGGLLVPPEDPEVVAQAIERALREDALVDSAAIVNWGVISSRMDYIQLKQKTIESYKRIYETCT